uniref:Obscurin like cytoskeletal adaptor 1a n=1 Tax=Echeneis naucrates TaxID=173247 RepID=A0A665WLU6_ECHNA
MDIFGGAPRVLGYPRPVVAQCGADATLKCQIGGDPRPDVIWERKNVQILSEGRYRLSEEGKAYLLTITGVTPEDAGQYICKARNSIGETYAAASLKVEGEARQQEEKNKEEVDLTSDEKPRFLIKPLSLRVDRGEDAAFSCKIWSTPLPEVIWEKDGKKLNDIFESSHFSVSNQDGGWFQLKIYRTRMPDKGVYTCKAVNCHGEALAGAVLLVEPIPEREEKEPVNPSTVKKFAVAEGKHAKFRCLVTGKPKPEIIWKKNGVPLDPGRRHLIFEDREGYYTLKVLYCKEQDTGLYVCAASNALGNTLSAVHLSVKGRRKLPVFTPLKDIEVRERDVAVLECEVPDESVPAAWYLEDQRLMPSSKYGMEQKGTKRRLTIHDVGTDDDGVYLCEMPDGAKSIAELSVKGTIVRKLPRKLEVLEGENAAFCVEVDDDDMEICWFKDGLELHETHQTILKSFGKTHILVFVNVAYQDSGVVTFVTGRSKTSSRLKVKASRHCPPICPVGVKMDVGRNNGVLLSWVPAPNSQTSTRSIFVLERQEVGSQEWQKCFTSETATSAEVSGDSVPCEGNYRFRVCCINKYGRSGHVEFPKVVHLVPGPKIRSRLQSCEAVEGEDACFSIELSASMVGTWFLNSAQLQHGGRYLIQQSQTKHSLVIHDIRPTEDTAEVTFIANGVRDSAVLKVRQPPVMIVDPKDDVVMESHISQEIHLQCELSRSSGKVQWFKDGQEVEESDKVQLISEGPYRRLTILCGSEEDGGEYVCKTDGDSVFFQLSVTEPPVLFVSPSESEMELTHLASESLVLSCEISRSDAPVQWYRDGLKVEEGPNLILEADGAQRRLVIPMAIVDDTGEYICDTEDDSVAFLVTIIVTLTHSKNTPDKLESFAGEPIVMEIEVSRSSAKVKWRLNGKEIEDNSNMTIAEDGLIRRLTIHVPTPEDSGKYTCDAVDEKIDFQVKVTEPPVKILRKSEVKTNLKSLISDDIVLECELSRANAVAKWYKDGCRIEGNERFCEEEEGTFRSLVILNAELTDSAEYFLDVVDDNISFKVTVEEPPVAIVGNSIDPDYQEMVAGDELILACEVSRANAAIVRWMKDWTSVEGERFQPLMEGHKRTLTIEPLRRSDAGEYTCDVSTDQIHFSLLAQLLLLLFFIIEMRIKFVRPLQDTVAHADGMVTLHCEVCKPKADVQWLKNGVEVVPSRRFSIRADGVERSLTIHRLTRDDAGEYTCESRDDQTVAFLRVEMPRVVEFLTELHNTTVLEGEDATFKCVVSPEDVRLVWLMDNEAIMLGDRFQATQNGLCHTLVIKKCQMLDCSRITAEAEGKLSKASLKVQEAQVMFTKKMEPIMAEEFGDATLETEISLETGEVQWMRQGVVIQPGPRYTLAQDGCKRSLVIHNLTLSDRGTYRCETLHDRTQVKVNVEPRKISIRKGLIDQETYERETASFEVELSHTDVEGIWQKDGIRVKPNNQWRVSTNGHVHSLTLSNLTLEDTGTIVFSAEGVRTTARLTIKETPVSILRALADVRVEEEFPATLECEFSRQNVEVRWLKNGKELKPGKNYRIYSMGRKRFCQILQCSRADSGTYTCDTGDINTSCSLEVYEHELEIVQDLEDLYIQEDQNAVFMCEVSLEDVAGEWYKDGQKIRPTSTIKIRTEGTKHFLLMCNVQAEDAGEIRFVARDVESTADLEVEELPVSIVKPLRDRTALEKHRVILECTVSSPRCGATWYKGREELVSSDRVDISVDGCSHKLVIQQVCVEDEGTYSIEVGEHTSKAKLMVEGKVDGMTFEKFVP